VPSLHLAVAPVGLVLPEVEEGADAADFAVVAGAAVFAAAAGGGTVAGAGVAAGAVAAGAVAAGAFAAGVAVPVAACAGFCTPP
jgi:hypothetical protein